MREADALPPAVLRGNRARNQLCLWPVCGVLVLVRQRAGPTSVCTGALVLVARSSGAGGFDTQKMATPWA